MTKAHSPRPTDRERHPEIHNAVHRMRWAGVRFIPDGDELKITVERTLRTPNQLANALADLAEHYDTLRQLFRDRVQVLVDSRTKRPGAFEKELALEFMGLGTPFAKAYNDATRRIMETEE